MLFHVQNQFDLLRKCLYQMGNSIHSLQPLKLNFCLRNVFREQETKQNKYILLFPFVLVHWCQFHNRFLWWSMSTLKYRKWGRHESLSAAKPPNNFHHLELTYSFLFLSLNKNVTDRTTLQFSLLLLEVLCPWMLPLIVSKEPGLGGRGAPQRHLLLLTAS